jgi:hypothetical protein
VILSYLETHLVEHCNLNCKGCGHFSSIAEEQFADFAIFERDFSRLGDLFENISTIRLMGGEPLLHPGVTSFTTCVRGVFPRAEICLVTNGILLPKQPADFWESCAANDIVIQITRYPISLDFDGIADIARGFGVKLQVSETISSFLQFMNFAGDSDAAVSFRNCQARFKCPFLQDGRISLCSMPASVHIFNQEFQKNIPVSAEDSIGIFGDTGAADILEFLNRPSRLCAWCLEDWPTFDWRVGRKTMDDWAGPVGDPRLPVLGN